jgi:NAD(P)-dependent dehydrogenase (short-subunit alcohol dehydrogenase family)
VEFGPDNVRINAIAPGVIRTEFARKLWDDDAAQDELNRRTPLRRIGEPEDIAGPAVFLASDASRYMTGHMVVVDGGSTIKGQL